MEAEHSNQEHGPWRQPACVPSLDRSGGQCGLQPRAAATHMQSLTHTPSHTCMHLQTHLHTLLHTYLCTCTYKTHSDTTNTHTLSNTLIPILSLTHTCALIKHTHTHTHSYQTSPSDAISLPLLKPSFQSRRHNSLHTNTHPHRWPHPLASTQMHQLVIGCTSTSTSLITLAEHEHTLVRLHSFIEHLLSS